jgi:phosphoribosylformimino-5-aminoimidazole carboxamide ribotide isomerase
VKDISRLKAHQGKNVISGSILGRALYDGDIDPEEALSMARQQTVSL